MKIKELNLKNFGKFSNQSFQFSDGINVIYGANEAGKTTLYHAIGALLFGLEKQRGRGSKSDTYTTYQPWENKTWYEGNLRFETGGKVFRLERNFYHTEKSVRLICETDGEELSVEQGDLEMLLGDTGAELYFNTENETSGYYLQLFKESHCMCSGSRKKRNRCGKSTADSGE